MYMGVWPMADRELCLEMSGYSRLENVMYKLAR